MKYLWLVFISLVSVVFAAEQPNFVVIMCDDLGYADVGYNGCKDIPTPHIDSIAENGVRFSSGYTSYPVCGPSRAGFITGRYQGRFGFGRNPQYRPEDPNMGLSPEEKTIADLVKPMGYTSAVIGKWHLGAHPSLHPLNRGFDFFYGHLGGGHRYLPEDLTLKSSFYAKSESESYRTWILRDHEHEPIDRYLTDEFSDEAIEFVKRSKDQPFFLFLAYNAPHTPLQAPEAYLQRFDSTSDPKRKTYAAMVSAVDDGVGRLLKTLRLLHLEENTLIFFLSDNGGPETVNNSNNGPLRGQKGSTFEGGYRVPFALQWKNTLKPGSVFDHPVSSLDILGTIAGLTQAPVTADKPLDGVNLIPYLNGEQEGVPHKMLFLRKFDNRAYTVRNGMFKLRMQQNGNDLELYNLHSDIGEKENLAAHHPEKVQELEQGVREWESGLKDPVFLGLMHTPEWQARHAK